MNSVFGWFIKWHRAVKIGSLQTLRYSIIITAENVSEPGELEMIYKRDCRHNVSVRKNVPSRYAATSTDKDERGDE